GVCFLVYYLTYVQQHREYLLNRDYRVLATMGEQMSETLANQMAILTSYVDSFENSGFDERYGVAQSGSTAADTTARHRVQTVRRTLGEPGERPYEVEGGRSTFGGVPMGEKSNMIHS